jgi:hypothetical protein
MPRRSSENDSAVGQLLIGPVTRRVAKSLNQMMTPVMSSTMRYVRPSATFIEDAYRRAVTSTLTQLSGEDGLA